MMPLKPLMERRIRDAEDVGGVGVVVEADVGEEAICG